MSTYLAYQRGKIKRKTIDGRLLFLIKLKLDTAILREGLVTQPIFEWLMLAVSGSSQPLGGYPIFN
jgi:hypothetical protein